MLSVVDFRCGAYGGYPGGCAVVDGVVDERVGIVVILFIRG